MRIQICLASVALGISLVGCHTTTTKSEATTPNQPSVAKSKTAADANLLQTEAEQRAALIGDVKYHLDIDVSAPTDTFTAREKIEFEVKLAGQDTFLDFKDGAKIISFSLNGVVLTPEFTHHRILLPAAKLNVGTNVAEIQYEQNYAHDGRGLHHFVDPEDKRIYLYTQFENFDAHQMFACFDQPDLKATMVMNVTTPKSWEVITTTRETSKVSAHGLLQWSFPETPRISTYLFSLHAGPYAKWESRAGDIPLRLFARQSQKRYVAPAEWFVPTQQGLKFYGEYFAYPYPFKKYDQVIVPEFNAGAMENVAAVTFSDSYFVHRSLSTYKEREAIASVLLHEMAHMWFGDLVTMQWWNAAWLNESFASYMSAFSMASATEFKDDAWISFYSRGKHGAYIEDQWVTTHPIEAHVPDTETAMTNFDAITYGKGASVLKQVAYYLGPDKFQEGVRYYFKTHAYKNTRLQDFMGALEHASGQDLKAWSHAWLESAGVDTVQADYACDKGKISHFALNLQGPDSGISPRVHRTMIRLYADQDGTMTPFQSQNVIYRGARTELPQFVGEACPAMVYANAEDHDYVKVSLDPITLEAVETDLAKVRDPFTRILFWPNLESMVRDVTLTPQDYIEVVKRNFPQETDLSIGSSIMDSLEHMFLYLPQSTTNEKQMRAEMVADVENLLWTKLTAKATPADWKRMILRSYSELVESKDGRDHLVGLVSGKIKVDGLIVDLDRKWEMLIRLSALGDERVQPLLVKMKKDDNSSRGVENAMAVDAAQPSLAVKDAWIRRITEAHDLSFTQKRTVLREMLPYTQNHLRASLSDSYYKAIPQLAATRELNFSSLYARTLMPTTCTADSATRIGKFVEKTGAQLPAPVVKSMLIGQQEDNRCVAIREFAAASNRAPANVKAKQH